MRWSTIEPEKPLIPARARHENEPTLPSIEHRQCTMQLIIRRMPACCWASDDTTSRSRTAFCHTRPVPQRCTQRHQRARMLTVSVEHQALPAMLKHLLEVISTVLPDAMKTRIKALSRALLTPIGAHTSCRMRLPGTLGHRTCHIIHDHGASSRSHEPGSTFHFKQSPRKPPVNSIPAPLSSRRCAARRGAVECARDASSDIA